MLSLWKLRVGVEAYYLAQVASGLDEYYTGAGEATGRWTGASSAGLGLFGDVVPDDLRAVLAGLAPRTALTPNGDRLTTRPRRVPGFDLTFSVPKSVSVVYALGDPLVQQAVVEGCEAALNEALAWLEREACFVRRGTNNRAMAERDGVQFGTRRVAADGFVAAQFRHRTSRAGDPHLHWHVLVANVARGIDGRWSALDGTALYRAQRSAGVVFQAAMRRELTVRLGVEWGPTHRDAADIAGIPARVLRGFSTRHEQIAEWLGGAGQEGAAAATTALLATRTRKQVPADVDTIEAAWRERASRLGWGPDELDRLLGDRPTTTDVPDTETWEVREASWAAGRLSIVARSVSFDEWLEWLLTSRVTATNATITRFDLTSAVASAMPAGASSSAVDAVVQRCLASELIVAVVSPQTTGSCIDLPARSVPDDRERRYTARSLLRIEEQLLDHLRAGVGAGVGVLEREGVDELVGLTSLGKDQQDAVMTLTSSGDGIALLVGRAGTGKTHTLGAVRVAYEHAGWTVVGLAPSARAARELEAGAGIDATTIARHLVEQRSVDNRTVIVVDEAGMAGTRDLAQVIDQATAAGAKVVLVGDHHQLPEVAAGGTFRAACDLLGDRVAELHVNRRQQEPWEQAALDQLRDGDVPTAFAAYRDHGRVVIADTAADLHAIAVADWVAARRDGETLLLAGTRAETRLLNRLARERLAELGRLDLSDQIEFADRSFVVRDEIVLLKNHRGQATESGAAFEVHNGMRGVVVGLTSRSMTVELPDGQRVRLDHDYLDNGWVDHGYALTVHKAQGITCDRVIVVGPAGLYREGAYVAMSRARVSAHLYATAEQAAAVEERHALGIPLPTEGERDAEAELLNKLQTSAAKTFVSIDDPLARRIAQLATDVPFIELRDRARAACQVERSLDLPDPTELRAALDRATATREVLAVGRRVRAIDRDNVGHVLAIADRDASCTVYFENAAGRAATRTMSWSELVVIDHPGEVSVSGEARHTLGQLRAETEAAEAAWAAALATHGLAPGDAAGYARAVKLAEERAAHALRAQPPDWLANWLGQRPVDAVGSQIWDAAAERVATFRLRHQLPEDVPGFGPKPESSGEAVEWRRQMLAALEDRCWIQEHDPGAVAPIATPLTARELVNRREELEQLLATAPADQRALIDRLAHSQVDPGELHEYLVAAMQAQDARCDWIIANWPHLIELEQVNLVLASQSAFAHWPVALPQQVQDVLDQLRAMAIPPEQREERSLAEIERARLELDPVHRIEQRLARLHQLVDTANDADAGRAVLQEITACRVDLRSARAERAVDSAMASYSADSPIRRRIATLRYDVLTSQPEWLVEELVRLAETGTLAATPLHSLAEQAVACSQRLDARGPTQRLPEVGPSLV